MPKGEAVRLFGTDGIRGVAGEFPLDPATLDSIGQALADNLASELGRPAQIVIGRDTRESGIEIERVVTIGAQRAGASIASAGVITTPGVAYLTRSIPFDAGIVISASHNPFRDNGIKVFTPSGRKLADDVERRIELEVNELEQRGNESSTPPAALGDLSTSVRQETSYQQLYIDHLVRHLSAGLNLAGMRIGIDCANGAASYIAPGVFEQLGASVDVISASPDGRNINENCGSLHQEALQRLVRDHRLEAGVSFDGDADRALFVDESGRQVDGDQMMLILADRMKKKGRLAGNVVVSTVMSNLGFEIALRDRGISLVRAQVGDRYVLDELLARNASLGGEQSGHIIMPDISLAGDGIVTAIEVLRAVQESGRTLGDLASGMKRCPQVLINVRVSRKPPIESVPEVARAIARVEEEMGGRGRLLVRYSGTENLARVMVEGEDQALIEAQAAEIAETLRVSIG